MGDGGATALADAITSLTALQSLDFRCCPPYQLDSRKSLYLPLSHPDFRFKVRLIPSQRPAQQNHRFSPGQSAWLTSFLGLSGRDCGVGHTGSMALGNAMACLTELVSLVTVNGCDKMRKLRNGNFGEEGKVDLQGTELAIPVARYLPLGSTQITELNVR